MEEVGSPGIAGQTNNAILVEAPAVAEAFLDYWQRMHDDKLPRPKPKLSSPMSATRQGADFRLAKEAVPSRWAARTRS